MHAWCVLGYRTAYRQARARVSDSRWTIPGKILLALGWILWLALIIYAMTRLK